MISQFFPLLFIFALALFYWRGLGVRSHATRYVASQCKKINVTLLDQHVRRRGLWMKRDQHGRLAFWWRFEFEVACSEDIHGGNKRYLGYITLLGKTVTHIHFPTIDWPVSPEPAQAPIE